MGAVIIHVNLLPKPGETGIGEVVAALFALVDRGRLDPEVSPASSPASGLIQYRANFREPVTVRHATDSPRRADGARRARGRPAPGARGAIARRGRRRARLRRRRRERPRDAERRRPRGLGAAQRERRLAVQPALLAATRRLGATVRSRVRGGAAERPIGRARPPPRSPMRWPTSGRSWSSSTSVASCRPRSSRSRSASARGTRAGLCLTGSAIDAARATGFYPRLRFLLADLFHARAPISHERGGGAPGRREHDRHRRAPTRPAPRPSPLQDPLRPSHERLRQPAGGRARPAGRPALPRGGPGASAEPGRPSQWPRPTASIRRRCERRWERLLESGPDLRRSRARRGLLACGLGRSVPEERLLRRRGKRRRAAAGRAPPARTLESCSRPRRRTSAFTRPAGPWRAS